jgi:hypothetical protein
MRRIALALTALGAMLLGAGSAQAAVLSAGGGTISYIADQGERNDLVVGTSAELGQPVFTFKDADANPINVDPISKAFGLCDLVNGVGMCRAGGITSFNIDVRDRDDTVEIATSGESGQPPPSIPGLIIGGRGQDILEGGLAGDTLKGNDGRDSLRGREGADVYYGGRGADTLQTLDGAADTSISCGEGTRDLLRADEDDPKPKSCELGGRNPSKRF